MPSSDRISSALPTHSATADVAGIDRATATAVMDSVISHEPVRAVMTSAGDVPSHSRRSGLLSGAAQLLGATI